MSELRRIFMLVLFAGIAILATPLLANTAKPKPKISMSQARATALKRVPGGKVRSEELEHEGGRWVYSFDIAVPGHTGIEEVQVDANRGQVVSHVHESPSKEQKEAEQERSESKHHSGAK